jgi:hypothetical protein
MKRVHVLGWVVACCAVVALASQPGPSAVPPPGRIDADFIPEGAVTQISWDPPIASAGAPGPYSYRYRYRREGGPWSAWRSTGFPGIDLHGTHERERIDVAVRTRTAAGDLSATTPARLAASTPATYDCKPHALGGYPSKCVAGATPPMGD